ncbi:MAG: VTT domain-containing protein [Candidatus Nanohaloarchaea archaeon]|nr:VTT domain-containing protein [Candidatus Nanohaloarchaea archaeon]
MSSLRARVAPLLAGIAAGLPVGYLQGTAVLDVAAILQETPLSGVAGQAYGVLEAAIATYGIWAYIGASALKGLLLFLLVPAESVTPLYIIETAASPLDVAVTVVIGAAAITAANFLVFLLAWVAGDRLFTERDSVTWRAVDWLIVEHGRLSMYLLRLIPWIGAWAAIPAGLARLNPRTFLVYSFLGFLTYETALGIIAYYGLQSGTAALSAVLPVLG